MKELWELFIVFAKIGGFTFGGGYAMLPILQREVVENRNWATSEELMDYYAIGQCTPGVIAVNTSTFIGYKTHGILGGIAATAGMITPSLILSRLSPHLSSSCASRCCAARVCRNPHRGLRARAAVRMENGEKGRC